MKTSIRSIFALGAILNLVACGGGNNDSTNSAPTQPQPASPIILTGNFGATPIVGAKYETATQSGVTSTTGEFSYVEGETVRFAIGGITLGSVQASTSIRLSDFYDASLPTNIAEIEKLSTDIHADEFDALLNLSGFLMSLDINEDQQDSIDIGRWEAPLANASIDFSVSLKDFVERQLPDFMNIYSLNEQRMAEGFVYLYGAEQIDVLESKITSDQNEDMNEGETRVELRTVTYNSQGQITHEINTEDDDNNGINESVDDITYTYDDAGNWIGRVITFDNDNDGEVDRIITRTNTFDDRGNMLTYVQGDDSNADGTAERFVSGVFTYNEMNLQTSDITENDVDGDGEADRIIEKTRRYDDAGNTTYLLTQQDVDGDGIIDVIEEETETFNENRETLQKTNLSDVDADGVVDFTTTLINTINEQNLIVSEAFVTVIGVDGPISRSNLSSFSYDQNGRRVQLRSESDYNGDGVINRIIAVEYTYNEKGQELTRNSLVDNSGTGENVSFRNVIQQYNDADLLVSNRSERGRNDVLENVDIVEFEYDDSRNLTREYNESITAGEATANFSQFALFTYNSDGLKLTEVRSSDNENDGNIDRVVSGTTEYQSFSTMLTVESMNAILYPQ